jgi:RNA polymerase sigma-70 factor (ECF subfamily)
MELIAGRRRHPGRAPSFAPEGASDEQLLAAMALGDVEAAEVFIRRHEQKVFAIALAITADRTTAEDVAQEAFLRSWRHAGAYDGRRGAATTWLAAITRNLAVDALRAGRAVPVDAGDPLWLRQVSEPGAVEARAVEADELARITAVVAALPVEQRRALMRAAFYGESATTVATAEQIPLGTAKSRIRLGLAKVRAALGEGPS